MAKKSGDDSGSNSKNGFNDVIGIALLALGARARRQALASVLAL